MDGSVRAKAESATIKASGAAALKVGDAAPGFIAVSTKGDIDLSLATAKGAVVLALYPADFTPG